MNLIELERALRQLRLGGVAAVLETRTAASASRSYGAHRSDLVSGERRTPSRRNQRLLERRRKQAAAADPQRALDNFDFNFNPKMNRSLVFDLATCTFIGKREDALFSGTGWHWQIAPGTGHRPSRHPTGLPCDVPGKTHVLLDEAG